MVNYILILCCLFFTGFTTFAQERIDFSGDWAGTCKLSNNNTVEDEISIKIDYDENSITFVPGRTYYFNKPTVSEKEGTYKGSKFKQVTAYDYQWDTNKENIKINNQWIGWYLEENRSWKGSLIGSIKMKNESLIFTSSMTTSKEDIYRANSNNNRVCTYKKVN